MPSEPTELLCPGPLAAHMELEQERLRKHKSSIWALVVFSAILLALTSSIFNGYAAIKPVLINEGVYKSIGYRILYSVLNCVAHPS